MKKALKKWALGATVFSLATLFAAAPVAAQEQLSADDVAKYQKEGRDEAQAATKVLNEIMNVPDKAIPRELLEKAKAIAVFPNVYKAGFIVGGRGGDGLVARRTATGWSAPVFYNIGGASFGAQIGVQNTDYVMLFMNDGALKELLDDKLEFEGNLSFAAGPVGRTVGAATNATLDSGILIWSRSKGLFAGATIGGAIIDADNNVNRALYNKKGGEVLENSQSVSAQMPSELSEFVSTLKRHAN